MIFKGFDNRIYLALHGPNENHDSEFYFTKFMYIPLVEDLENNTLKSNFINMAKETGMALDDVTRSAVLFYQQGLNTEEVMEMIETLLAQQETVRLIFEKEK